MSPGGNHTVAIINGTEKYKHLKSALVDIIKEVSELKTLSVDQNKFEIEYFLCCDLKFLAIFCGVESVTSTYPCVLCTCPSSKHADMTIDWSFLMSKKVQGPLNQYLRITDVLFNLLIMDLQRYDAVARRSTPPRKSHYVCREALVFYQ